MLGSRETMFGIWHVAFLRIRSDWGSWGYPLPVWTWRFKLLKPGNEIISLIRIYDLPGRMRQQYQGMDQNNHVVCAH